MSLRAPPLRLEPGGEERLASQARALARHGGEAGPEEGSGTRLVVVTFQVGGRPFAVEARAVARAVTRLGPLVVVPTGGGRHRLVAWIEERPTAVIDLGTLAGLAPRPLTALARAPALLVLAPAGAVAFAVEGPMLLAEERLALLAGPTLREGGGLRLVGRLDGGAGLLEGDWLALGGAGAHLAAP